MNNLYNYLFYKFYPISDKKAYLNFIMKNLGDIVKFLGVNL